MIARYISTLPGSTEYSAPFTVIINSPILNIDHNMPSPRRNQRISRRRLLNNRDAILIPQDKGHCIPDPSSAPEPRRQSLNVNIGSPIRDTVAIAPLTLLRPLPSCLSRRIVIPSGLPASLHDAEDPAHESNPDDERNENDHGREVRLLCLGLGRV